MKKNSSEIIHLLWTGGWDSTFRLLELTLVHRVEVQPLYLVDHERRSTEIEREVMETIRVSLAQLDPDAPARIRPSRFVDRKTVPANLALSKMWAQLGIGSQYNWLARFAEHEGLDGLELGAVKGGGNMYRLLWPYVQKTSAVAGPTYRVHATPVHPNLALFSRFSLPILHLTKPEMKRLAKERGWMPVMEHTWFCFNPKGGKPCGSCAPCMVAVKSGMAWRIPWHRRFRPRLRHLKIAVVRTWHKVVRSLDFDHR